MIPLYFRLPIAGRKPSHLHHHQQECQDRNDGIQLIVTVVDELDQPVNLRTASSLTIYLQAPDGTTLNRTSTLLTSGLDGKLQYTTVKSDLTQDGLYQIQAAFVIGGNSQTTRWGRFQVGPNIEDDD